MKPRTPRLQTLFLFLLLLAASLTSGCVYLRLLQLKNQLADFDKNFSAETRDGLRIVFKSPVLLGDDVRWLGAEPETIRKSEMTELWTVRWTKDPPTGPKETGVYDILIQAEFEEHRLQAIVIPERYFAFVPKDLFLTALRSAGHAKIDRTTRQAEMDTATAGPGAVFEPADRASIEKMLGRPTQLTAEQDLLRYRYVFRPQTPNALGKPVEITFVFDATSGILRRLVGRLPKGTLRFDFTEPAAP